MKITRFISTILCSFILIFLLASCSGYNFQIRKLLSDTTNYGSYRGEIYDIYYFDSKNNKKSVFSSDGLPEQDVVIEITFDDYDTVKNFLGGDPNPDKPLNGFKFQFEITKENNQILIENGFYNNVAINTPII